MLKWLAILALLCGTGYAWATDASKEKDGSSLAKSDGAASPSPTVSIVNNQTCPPNAKAADTQTPHWYASPEWWLCILGVPTLLFIGWQAKATGDAASATRESAAATQAQAEISRKAFISQFRPKVPVRTLWLTEEKSGALKVEVWLTNTGGTPAHLTDSDIKVGWEVDGEPSKKRLIASGAFQRTTIGLGQDHPAVIDITEQLGLAYRTEMVMIEEHGADQKCWIICFGHLTYLDDNGASRSTGFLRRYNIKRKRFIPSDDPEEEYCD